MQREEKQLESSLEAIIQRVNDLKVSIGSMIMKLELEFETLHWPTFLDNFAIISGHLTALSKILSHDKSPALRNLTVLPLLLSPERDEDLLKLTEHRVPIFNHDLVPDYLRTKTEPEMEHKMLHIEHKVSNISLDNAQKQVAAYFKVVNHVWDMVNKARDEWDNDASGRSGIAQTSSVADTHALVAAVGLGKGLKPMVPQQVQPVPQGMMVAPVGRPGSGPPTSQGPSGMAGTQPGQMGGMNKAPSAIKTNIKAASQIHPYTGR